MLCEQCKKRTATVFYNENINGKVRSFSLCGECAAKMREKGDIREITSMSGSFADPFSQLHDEFFGGFFGIPLQKTLTAQKKCPTCSMTFAEISKSGRVGCPDCYTAFQSELRPTLRSIHGTTAHTGAVPARHRAKQERNERLKSLKKQLGDAISQENYEQAAALRDEIRTLQAEKEKEGN
ncbi:MAG: UvrB/UvrC motif-containing protein [Clostridia bacterium]|nr:UvrB/UvrC motif-containing protein [Clostridia bacterium]